MIKLMDMEYILIWMEQDMREVGKKISNMGRDRRLGQIKLFMMEIM